MMLHATLPISPTPGLNRSELFTLFDWIVSTHMQDATPGYAGLELGATAAGFDDRAAELEGLSRLFWGVAFALNGERRLTGENLLLQGLANGADSAHPSYWGQITDNDQRAVEAAAIAAAFLENPQLAAKLGDQATEQVMRWFSDMQSIAIHPNNWRFFRILAMKALLRSGRAIDEAVLNRDLDFIDSQYIGGGWYGDNVKQVRDYYNGFAFHYYSLLYARWFANEEPERCRRFVERAREFALTYRYWFDDDGAHIAYGRSLTYRFATVGFWPLLASFGHPEISVGELRGLWGRSIAWWLGKRVFDANGRISIGFAYPNLLMSEFYNSPQSPLWAMKAFFPLALPGEHPFWVASPEPCRYAASVRVDRAGGFILQRKDGGAYMLTGAPVSGEMRNCVDKYGKFAYSSRHGFSVEAWRWLERGHLGDNILAFSANGSDWFGRTEILESRIEGAVLITVWSPLPGCRVETRQEFVDGGERRTHIVVTDTPLTFFASGHAVDAWRRVGIRCDLPAQGDTPAAVGKTLYSDIADVQGVWKRGVIATAPNTNLMFPHASSPAITGEVRAGKTIIDTVLRYGKVKESHD